MSRLIYNIVMGSILLLVIIFVLMITGCYNQRKATVQHGKAVGTYPAIGADYCARTYPVTAKLIPGDTTVQFDTLWGAGEVIYDTTYSRDTIRLTKIVNMPGKVITKTILIVDTLRVVDRAALDLCSIERGSAITQLEKRTAEYDRWRAIAKKRFWIIIGLSVTMAIGIYAAIRKKIVKPI